MRRQAELALAEDFDQIRSAMEKVPPYQSIFTKVRRLHVVVQQPRRCIVCCLSRQLLGCPLHFPLAACIEQSGEILHVTVELCSVYRWPTVD